MRFKILMICSFLLAFNAQAQVAEYLKEAAYKLNKLDFKGAEKQFSKALKKEPQNIKALQGRGGALMAQEEYEAAEEDFTNAIAVDKRNAQLYLDRARARVKLKNYKGAIEDLEKANVFDQELAEAYYLKGQIHWALKEKERACYAYGKAADLGFEQAHQFVYQNCK